MSRNQIIAYNKGIYFYICDSYVIEAPLASLEVFGILKMCLRIFFPL